jgi:polyketide synthase 12
LRLLPRGGRFVEMGKRDMRDPVVVAQEFAGVAYRAFDLMEAGTERIGQMLAILAGLFGSGVLVPLPVACWDVRRAREAFRFISQARHTGKVALVMPRPAGAASGDGAGGGVVLVTGGTGVLGALVARHLAARGQARRLVLASRSGRRGWRRGWPGWAPTR